MPRSIRSAATPARRRSSSAVSRRLPLKRRDDRSPRLDPCAVLIHERPKRCLGRGAIGERPERLHRQLDARHVHGRRLLHLGARDPRGAEQLGTRRPRPPIRPRRRGRWRTRACRRSGDRRPARPTPPPARRAGPAAAQRDGRCAPRSRAGRRRRGRASPRSECGGSPERPRPSACPAGCAPRDPGGDQPLDDVELEAAGAGHVVHHRISRPRERHGNRRLARLAAARRRWACRPSPSISVGV